MTSFTLRAMALATLGLACLSAHASDLLGNILTQAIGQVANQAVNQALKPGQTQPGVPGQFPQPVTGDAGGTSPFKLESGARFTPHDVVQSWQQPGSVAPMEGPSGQARGHVTTQTSFGGDLGVPGGADMRRKLDRMFAVLLKEPSLVQPLGVSLEPGGSFGGSPGAPRGPAVIARLSIRAFPIRLEDPATKRHPDGTAHTSGVGDSLNVVVNDLREFRRTELLGTYNGLTIMRRGPSDYQILLMNTDRPLLVGGVLNPDLIDASRPPSDIQFMVVYVGSSSPVLAQLAKGKLPPASGTGRLLAAAYNTDWQRVLRQAQ